jgi:hypothetical protein
VHAKNKIIIESQDYVAFPSAKISDPEDNEDDLDDKNSENEGVCKNK